MRGWLDALSQLRGQEKFSPSQLLNVAIEHRLMHAETLAYMLHQLPFDNKVRKPRLPELVVRPVEPRMIEIPAGYATLGLARAVRSTFGWDNEYEAHTVAVPAFSIDQYEVTNREYLQFMMQAAMRIRPCGARPTGSGRRSKIFRTRSFGIASTASGSTGPCSRMSPSRWTGRFT